MDESGEQQGVVAMGAALAGLIGFVVLVVVGMVLWWVFTGTVPTFGLLP